VVQKCLRFYLSAANTTKINFKQTALNDGGDLHS